MKPIWLFLFIGPTILCLLAVAGWPLCRTIYLSFTDASLANADKVHFVGLKNFTKLLTDPEWWHTVKNTLVFAIFSVSAECVLGLIVALVLNKEFFGRSLLRAAVLVPWAIPSVVCAKIWAWMLNDSFGIVNELLLRFHIIHAPIAWTANPQMSMVTVVAIDVWKTTPFMALLILAALQGIPKNLYEAAKIDGISRLRTFWAITLPYIKPALIVAVIFRILDALRVFDIIYVLVGNNGSTQSISGYAREQLIDFQDFGYGSAVSFMIFILIAAVTIMYLRFVRPDYEMSAA